MSPSLRTPKVGIFSELTVVPTNNLNECENEGIVKKVLKDPKNVTENKIRIIVKDKIGKNAKNESKNVCKSAKKERVKVDKVEDKIVKNLVMDKSGGVGEGSKPTLCENEAAKFSEGSKGAKWFNSKLVERVNLTRNPKRKCECGIRKYFKVDVCEALEKCVLDPVSTPKCCIDESSENCTFSSLSLMVSKCLIDSRRKLVPSMISLKNKSHLNPINPFGSLDLALNSKYGDLETERPPPLKIRPKRWKISRKWPLLPKLLSPQTPKNSKHRKVILLALKMETLG